MSNLPENKMILFDLIGCHK